MITNDEDILLGAHAIHLREDLVDNTVCRTTGITHGAASGLGDGVQLIEEQHTRRR